MLSLHLLESIKLTDHACSLPKQVTQQNIWGKVADYLGFPIDLPGPYAFPRLPNEPNDAPSRMTTVSAELVCAIYQSYLTSFEGQWASGKMAQFRQQQQVQSSGMASPGQQNRDLPGAFAVPAQFNPMMGLDNGQQSIQSLGRDNVQPGPTNPQYGQGNSQLPDIQSNIDASTSGPPQANTQDMVGPSLSHSLVNAQAVKLESPVTPQENNKKRKKPASKTDAAKPPSKVGRVAKVCTRAFSHFSST